MHEDLDRPVIESEGVDQWYDFLLQYYGVVLYKEKMVPGRNDDTEKVKLQRFCKIQKQFFFIGCKQREKMVLEIV